MEIGLVVAGRYEVLGLVAEGGTGTVWRVLDRESGREVAIKSVSLERHGWRAEVRDRLTREAELLARIEHENVVRLHASGETEDGLLYVVLDLLHGETLAERRVRPPPLGWAEAAEIALGIARGLAALHDQGVVHRDVKPANVVLDAGKGATAPVPKLIDLGISRSRGTGALGHHTLTATGEVLGTPAYMSLEQARGEPDIDPRSDVWSLGVVMYEMLSGRLPFDGPNVNAILAAVRRGERARLQDVAPRVPQAVCRIVERCLAKDRAERFDDASALAAALEAVVLRGRARRTRAIVALASGLLAIAAALFAIQRWASTSDRGAAAHPEPVDPPGATPPSSAHVSPAAPVEGGTLIPATGAPGGAGPASIDGANADRAPAPTARTTSSPAAASPLAAPAPTGSPAPVTKVDDPGF